MVRKRVYNRAVNQLLLALRNLAIALAVFLALAALTAHFFGGALFGRNPVVAFHPMAIGGTQVFLTVEGSKEGPGPVVYALMERPTAAREEARPVVPLQNGRPAIAGAWRRVIGPMIGADGVLRAAVGADRGGSALDWWMVEIQPGERATARPIATPDAVIEALLESVPRPPQAP